MEITNISYVRKAGTWLISVKEASQEMMSTEVILIAAASTIVVAMLTFMYVMKSKLQTPVASIPEVQTNRKYRFRKRDKMKFYARKVLRKGKDTATKLQRQVSLIRQGVSVPEFSRSGRRLDKKERMLILAKQVFSKKKGPSLLMKKELPSQVLEADITDDSRPNLPDEVFYLLKSVKVFGHFEQGVFFKLCKHVESIPLKPGELLFEVGQTDKWLYVVQEGQINLYIHDKETEIKLSEITAGESLHSLLSILDVLTGHEAPYKTVFARAEKKSIVIRLPAEAFSDSFKTRKQSLVQIVQVIMTRLQRVTFLALHNYLGLSQELLKPTNYGEDKKLKIRQRTSVGALTGMAEKHRISTASLEEQSMASDDDAVATRQKVRPNRTLSAPNPAASTSFDSSLKIKPKIRFSKLDTVVDPQDKVIQKQSNYPLDKPLLVRESIKMNADAAVRDDSIREHKDESGEISNDDSSSLGSNNDQKIFELNEPEVLELVTSDMCGIFGIDDEQLMKENILLLKACKGYELIAEGDQDVSLYLVVMGCLKVSQSLPQPGFEDTREVLLFTAEAGMITGQLAVLTGEPSFFSVNVVTDSVVARVTRGSFYKIMQKYPHIILNISHTVMMRVSPFVRQIDFALDWVVIEAGKPLYRQGSRGDCMYIVLHGRLRSVLTNQDGTKELVAEYGKGEIVGMTEALKGINRPTSLHAVRDTELAKMPEGLVKHIKRSHPAIVTRLMSLMSDKLFGNILSQRQTIQRNNEFFSHETIVPEETSLAYGDVSNHLANLSTVAILPSSHDVPLDKFSMELHHSLTHIYGHSVLRLSSDLVKQRLGVNALESVQDYRLSKWLAHHEDINQMVLYQTDYGLTPWTHRCIRQADAILIVALGDGEPALGELESALEGMGVEVRALKVLVLLHRPSVVQPTHTVDWLNMRGWLTDYVHIKGPKRLFIKTKKSKMAQFWEKLKTSQVNRFSDFSRLARFLTGTTVALVLGGGGARGLSHIGIIQSLVDADIPIDMIGGTSIGAFVGGLWAAHRDVGKVKEKTLVLCNDMGSYLSKILDLTYPFTSMFSGSAFNKPIKMVFGDTQIEDLWLPYFTITTDITASKMKVHTDGLIWRYVRASMTYHPYLPPMCDDRDDHLLLDGCFVNNLPGWLWRYVRSSMSLSGYLPPLCDPKDDHLLMDGGYINNLPGDVARSRGAWKVIAVDVSSLDEDDFTNYGDHLSGWWLLWKRLTGRWTGRVKIPDLNEIQSRLSYISCNYLLEKVKRSDYCFYVRPPISNYKTLEFHKHKELFEVGLKHGHGVFTEEWKTEFWNKIVKERLGAKNHLKARGDISFTDLSEVICQLDPAVNTILSESENDYEMGYESSPEFSLYSSLVRNASEPYNLYQLGERGTTSLSDIEPMMNGPRSMFARPSSERRNSLSIIETDSHKHGLSSDEELSDEERANPFS